MHVTEWIGFRTTKRNAAPFRKVGDIHARQPAAAVERKIPDARHAVRYRHARQPAAAGERRRTDCCHAVRYRQCRDLHVVQIEIMRATEWIGFSITKRDAAPLRKIGDVHARQPAAAVERIIPDVRHAVRYRHARQPAAAAERRRPDARHAVRYRHARQPTAVEERRRPNVRHRLTAERGWNRDIALSRRNAGYRGCTAADSIRPRVSSTVRPCIGMGGKCQEMNTHRYRGNTLAVSHLILLIRFSQCCCGGGRNLSLPRNTQRISRFHPYFQIHTHPSIAQDAS